MLVKVLDLYAVPLCAGLLGWILGASVVLGLLHGVGQATTFAQLADSSLLRYGVQLAAAVTFFGIAHRYLS
jgi:hypothetical protein